MNEKEIEVLRHTLVEYGLRQDKVEDFIELFSKNISYAMEFDPFNESDLEI